MKIELSAIILAGGESSRMGTDKALLLIEGVPMLKKLSLLAGNLTANVYIITSWPEHYQSILPQGCQLILEKKSTPRSNGPLMGFAQAIGFIESEWVLLLACDLPRLTLEVLTEGYQSLPSKGNHLPDKSQNIMAYLPRNNDRWEPLCGFYHRSCFSSVLDYLETGQRSFQGWLNSLPVQEWIISDPSVLFNCNTPEDFQNYSC